MRLFKIIETNAFDKDCPKESFLNLPPLEFIHATVVARAINECFSNQYPRYWRIVDKDYVLKP